MARKTEFSVSYLSQVERNLVGPSVAALMKIAAAPGSRSAQILAQDERSSAGAKLVRPQERKTLSYPGSDIRYELLSPDLANRAMEVLMFRAPAGSTSGAEPFAHDGEECFVLIKGRLRVWVGEEEHLHARGRLALLQELDAASLGERRQDGRPRHLGQHTAELLASSRWRSP